MAGGRSFVWQNELCRKLLRQAGDRSCLVHVELHANNISCSLFLEDLQITSTFVSLLSASPMGFEAKNEPETHTIMEIDSRRTCAEYL